MKEHIISIFNFIKISLQNRMEDSFQNLSKKLNRKQIPLQVLGAGLVNLVEEVVESEGETELPGSLLDMKSTVTAQSRMEGVLFTFVLVEEITSVQTSTMKAEHIETKPHEINLTQGEMHSWFSESLDSLRA